jgi:hypothetical protein
VRVRHRQSLYEQAKNDRWKAAVSKNILKITPDVRRDVVIRLLRESECLARGEGRIEHVK